MLIVFILIKNKIIWKLIQMLLLSAVKFLFAPPVAIEIGFNYIETLLITISGGILGVVFFYYLSGALIIGFNLLKVKLKHIFSSERKKELIRNKLSEPVKKKIFTLRNKIVVKMKKRVGMFGIIAVTPFISIPLAAFLVRKYYSRHKWALAYFAVSIIFWSFLFSTIYFFKLKHLI
jgi:uncharacterized membrane protein